MKAPGSYPKRIVLRGDLSSVDKLTMIDVPNWKTIRRGVTYRMATDDEGLQFVLAYRATSEEWMKTLPVWVLEEIKLVSDPNRLEE